MTLSHPNSFLQVLVPVQQWLLLGQRLTKTLRLGSEDPNLGLLGFVGGSYIPSLYSKPYVMFSAPDPASAAIDFSRAGVDEGAVDSPPGRGPARTPLCSPSPLKRVVSTPLRSRSLSPTLRTHTTPHMKLYGSADNDNVDPCFRNLGAMVVPPRHHLGPMTIS